VRTGTSLFSFDFTIYNFFQELHNGEQVMPPGTLFGA
jgi:hypothetical protein